MSGQEETPQWVDKLTKDALARIQEQYGDVLPASEDVEKYMPPNTSSVELLNRLEDAAEANDKAAYEKALKEWERAMEWVAYRLRAKRVGWG